LTPQKNLNEIVKDEFLRCAVDPAYFARKYCKISHPTKGKIGFDLYPFQDDCLREMRDNRFSIILKSRQMGISTLSAMFSLHSMLFNDEFKILVIATKQEVAKNLTGKVQLMFENLPAFIKQGISVVTNNRMELTFSNGSGIKAVASSPNAGRSEGLSCLIIDEAAHIDHIEEIWASAQPTLSTGGKCIMLSTPNGQQGVFYRIWQQAEEGSAGDGFRFKPISLPWHLHPERDQSWRDEQEAALGKRMAAQETDCSFLSSGNTVLEPEILSFYSQKIAEPIEKRGIGGDFWVWKYPEPTHSYIVAADVARGDGEDYSGAIVLDVETCEQVAEYKGKIDTQAFGRMLVVVATEYNSALLIIDNKNIGWSTVQVALDLKYQNLYYSYKNDPFLDENIHLRRAYDMASKEDMVPGLTTTTRIRPVLVSKLENYFREFGVLVRSVRLVNELKVFVWIGGKPQAQRGYNDDLVMSLAMALYVRDTSLRLHQMGIDLTKRAIQNVHRAVYKPENRLPNEWTVPVAGKRESIRWLVSK
jgi:hypothetical protein